jgi:WD40 repeat protein
VWHLSSTPDGRTLQAAFGFNSTDRIRAWDLTTGRLVAERDASGCLAAALSPAGDRAILLTLDIYRGVGVDVVPLAEGNRWSVRGSQFALLSDGSRLVVGDLEEWHIHDLASGSIQKSVSFPKDFGGSLRALACSPDGLWLAASSQADLLIWDLRLGVEKARTAVPVRIDQAVYHPAGALLALGSKAGDGTIYLFDGMTLEALPGSNPPKSLHFCPRADCLVVLVFPAPSLRVWDLTTRTNRCAIDFCDTDVFSLAGPANGTWVAAGCRDGTIRFIPGEVFAV